MLIDADGHVMEPADVWVDRMDRGRWGDLIPHYVAEDTDGKDSWYVGGVRRAAGSAIFGCSAGFDPEELLSRELEVHRGPRRRVGSRAHACRPSTTRASTRRCSTRASR